MLLTGPQSKQMNWWLQNLFAWLYPFFFVKKRSVIISPVSLADGPDFNEISWELSVSREDMYITCMFCTMFLAHLSRRLMGELIVYQSLRRPSVRPSVVRPSVCQHFQTSSPLKPLGQLISYFIWRLLRKRERKFVQMVLVTWPRWPPRPYMVKTL